MYLLVGGGFKYFFIFTPDTWGRWTHFDQHIFQMGGESTINQLFSQSFLVSKSHQKAINLWSTAAFPSGRGLRSGIFSTLGIRSRQLGAGNLISWFPMGEKKPKDMPVFFSKKKRPGPWLFRGFVGDQNPTPVMWGWFQKPWHKDPYQVNQNGRSAKGFDPCIPGGWSRTPEDELTPSFWEDFVPHVCFSS